jgi:hypothetical protein
MRHSKTITILLNGLRLAAADSRLGHLDDERLERILATVAELTIDLDSHDDVEIAEPDTQGSGLSTLTALEDHGETVTSVPAIWKAPDSILCLPGLNKLDEAAALVLAQMLRRKGFGATAEKADALSMSRFFSLDLTDRRLICICYVDRPSNAKIRYAVRRLGQKRGAAAIVLAFLGD